MMPPIYLLFLLLIYSYPAASSGQSTDIDGDSFTQHLLNRNRNASSRIYSNGNVNLGNLDVVDGSGRNLIGGGGGIGGGAGGSSGINEPKLTGPNVCTKQEP